MLTAVPGIVDVGRRLGQLKALNPSLGLFQLGLEHLVQGHLARCLWLRRQSVGFLQLCNHAWPGEPMNESVQQGNPRAHSLP